MEIRELKCMESIEQALGNKFLSCMIVSELARRLGTSKGYYKYHLSESALIEWVVTGKTHYSKLNLENRIAVTEHIDDIDNVLCWVSDEEIVEEVKSLYKESIRNRKLLTCQRKDFNTYQRDRSNILLRLIWYACSEEEE